MLAIAACWSSIAGANPVVLDRLSPATALGLHMSYMQEPAAPMSLEEAQAALAAGRFRASTAAVLAFGIGSPPVWVHMTVVNAGAQKVTRRLLIENPWLDHIDVLLLEDGRLLRHVTLGDSQPQSIRPVPGRFFAVDHDFDIGTTELFLRVETPDPIVLPVFLMSPAEADRRELNQGYGYGFIYGYLAALLVYNLVLFASLRNRIYLSYGGFLAAFLGMNLAYTGHAFAWWWPEQTILQQWIIPILMVLFGISGLAFAKTFLNTATRAPHLHRTMSTIAGLSAGLLAMAMLISGNQRDALLVAFIFVTLFSGLMPLLGVVALRSGHPYARYFLVATLASMTGTLVTALAVWGFMPYSDWKFRAVEVGMLVDATVLALALGRQFRSIRMEYMLAEKLASRDSLTDLYNRRSFLDIARSLWSAARRNGRPLSLILLDIDHFKKINDGYGHGVGDAALVETAKVLTDALRQGDIVSRWGGEEFLLMLPDTSLEAAITLAERLRHAIADIRVDANGTELSFTASFGVAQQTRQESLDHLITETDNCLYRSKRQGRNRTSYEPGAPRPAYDPG